MARRPRWKPVRGIARPGAIGLLTAMSLAACGSGETTRSTAATQTGTQTRTGTTSSARTASKKHLRLKLLADFRQPVYVTGAPADPSRLFVLQKGGAVMLLRNGHRLPHPFLIVPGVNSSGEEQGLLGIAFAPDFASSGAFYVDYTLADDDVAIVRYERSTTNPDLADPASARRVLTIPHPNFNNHNGGQLAFGPEGDLYIGVGDGGSEDDPNGNGQSTSTLLGKILRIAPSPVGGYTIPSGNPFVGQAGKRPEIWAYGLRNPWRFSFDRASGALVIGDVGQDEEEEIDYLGPGSGAGSNFGWSIFEGDRRNKPGNAPDARPPALVLLHSQGYCAVIGGYVVRDHTLPSLYGRYVFGDFCRPEIESVRLSGGHATGLRETGLSVKATSSLGQDAAGHVYVTSLQGGLYRIVSG